MVFPPVVARGVLSAGLDGVVFLATEAGCLVSAGLFLAASLASLALICGSVDTEASATHCSGSTEGSAGQGTQRGRLWRGCGNTGVTPPCNLMLAANSSSPVSRLRIRDRRPALARKAPRQASTRTCSSCRISLRLNPAVSMVWTGQFTGSVSASAAAPSAPQACVRPASTTTNRLSRARPSPAAQDQPTVAPLLPDPLAFPPEGLLA